MRQILGGLASLALSFGLLGNQVLAQDEEKTCNLYQTCASNAGVAPGDKLGTCKDPLSVTQPVFWEGGFAPALMTDETGVSSMADACPYIDLTQPICCGADNAQIMQANYDQLDAVFFPDCPICATNLKRMWCEYACNSIKGNFITTMDPPEVTIDDVTYTNVNVNIDVTYSCGIFKSCEKESYIAQAGITSSIAFLDFMGYNGAPYSLSFIYFTEIVDSTPENAMQGVEETDWWPCDFAVPDDGMLSGYDSLYNTTCSYCDAACEAPAVNADIGFLDGLSWPLVGWTYLAFVLFTILFQVVNWLCCEKRTKLSLEQKIAEYARGGDGSQTSGKERNSGKLGRPLNVTDTATQNSGMLDSNRLEDED